jgi:hypothetical protein
MSMAERMLTWKNVTNDTQIASVIWQIFVGLSRLHTHKQKDKHKHTSCSLYYMKLKNSYKIYHQCTPSLMFFGVLDFFLQKKVDRHRTLNVGLGNVMIPSGNLDIQPKFRQAQIFEGPAMEAKREMREQREQIENERRALANSKEDDKKARQIEFEAERLRIIVEKQAKDREKEDVREKFMKEREDKKLMKDEVRKEQNGWSIEHALKGMLLMFVHKLRICQRLLWIMVYNEH